MVLLKKINREVKKIGIIKDWLEFKSIYNIQVFLNFTNFYQQFILNFNRIVALLTSILKITRLFNKLVSGKNNNNKLAFNKNNDSRSIFEKNNVNNQVNKFSVNDNDIKYITKSRK